MDTETQPAPSKSFRGAALARQYYHWLGPWVSLGLGLLTIRFLRHGFDYAPIAALLVLLGWTSAAFLQRLLDRRAQVAEPTRRERILQSALSLVVASTFQNVLFFLVPLWLTSATWPSWNIAFPVLLALMAVVSCFDRLYFKGVMQRPWSRTIWSGLLLFACLDPAVLSWVGTSSRWRMALTAGLSALIAGLVQARRARPRRAALLTGAGVVVTALAALLVQPLLPPVPIVLVGGDVGTDVVERYLEGQAESFPAGVERVYAWFSVAAPAAFEQRVRFVWSRDGDEIGRPHDTQIVGGRQSGFRTWSYASRPPAGEWQVELLSEAGQLIGRRRFTVCKESEELRPLDSLDMEESEKSIPPP